MAVAEARVNERYLIRRIKTPDLPSRPQKKQVSPAVVLDLNDFEDCNNRFEKLFEGRNIAKIERDYAALDYDLNSFDLRYDELQKDLFVYKRGIERTIELGRKVEFENNTKKKRGFLRKIAGLFRKNKSTEEFVDAEQISRERLQKLRESINDQLNDLSETNCNSKYTSLFEFSRKVGELSHSYDVKLACLDQRDIPVDDLGSIYLQDAVTWGENGYLSRNEARRTARGEDFRRQSFSQRRFFDSAYNSWMKEFDKEDIKGILKSTRNHKVARRINERIEAAQDKLTACKDRLESLEIELSRYENLMERGLKYTN